MSYPRLDEPKLTVFICGRNHDAVPLCKTPGCGIIARKRCDFPVLRGGKAATCGREICARCATNQGPEFPNLDFCPPHEKNKPKR